MTMISDIGVRALMANQSALQTISNNIANVNTPGYSRQSTVQAGVAGQFSGSGYYGQGVEIVTVQRAYDAFLTRQSALSKAIAAADTTRSDKLGQLEAVFQGGPDGLGASVNNLFNSFSDITNAPTDLTARSVTLTRADEMAARFRDMARQLNDLRLGTAEQIRNDISIVNNLAKQIAAVNEQIARNTGSGHAPNDLLDRRDQLIRDLNKYVQTTQIGASDGSMAVFLANSQPLVLGKVVSSLNVVNDAFNDPSKLRLTMTVSGMSHPLDESLLGGGEVSGLLRFHNSDLVDAGNMLGRMALAIGTKMNQQQALGLDLQNNPGAPLFSLRPIPNGLAAETNSQPGATIAIAVRPPPANGPADFIPSDYQLRFTTGTTGTITRLSDGQVTSFDLGLSNPIAIDGFDFSASGSAAPGDTFLLKPFSAAADRMTTAFSSPTGLAIANPLAAQPGGANLGTLSLDKLALRVIPAAVPPATAPTPMPTVQFSFAPAPATSYTYTYTSNVAPFSVVSGSGTYTPGMPITVAADNWMFDLTLKGVPSSAQADTFTVAPNAYPAQSGGNAEAMLDLRDYPLFDGGPLTDGYAGVIAQIGTKVQSAKSAAAVSQNIAVELERERTSVAGVNLDEEAAMMLQYQQAYQASGKMLQVAQNIFDALLQTVGR